MFKRIGRLSKEGWTFVHLGANQDSYAVGAAMGVGAGSTSNYASSPTSVLSAQRGLSRSMRSWRSKPRSGRLADADEFWEGVKEGEASDAAGVTPEKK